MFSLHLLGLTFCNIMSSINLRSLLENNKLTGPNYLDWLRNVKVVLKSEKKVYVIDTPLPELAEDAT